MEFWEKATCRWERWLKVFENHLQLTTLEILHMPRRRAQTKTGQAASLPGKLWEAWTQHLLKTGPTWVWVAVILTHILCCRITEILWLRNNNSISKDAVWQFAHWSVNPRLGFSEMCIYVLYVMWCDVMLCYVMVCMLCILCMIWYVMQWNECCIMICYVVLCMLCYACNVLFVIRCYVKYVMLCYVLLCYVCCAFYVT